MSADVAPGTMTNGPGAIPVAPSRNPDFPWRVFALLNTFRTVISLILLGIFSFVREPRIIGEFVPALAAPALISLLLFSIVEYFLINRRWPNTTVQTYGQFGVDLVLLVLLLHSSGGIVSGTGGLIVVSVGTLALLVPLDRALLLAAVTTFALLAEQTLSLMSGLTVSTDYAATGILAAVIFVITAVVQLLRRQIVETEALAEQRGVDLRNLVELNEYIIQHLRESIVVVDANDRIRLVNESAGKLLGGRTKVTGLRLADIAPSLARYLAGWRAGDDDLLKTTLVIGGDANAANIHPHFARLGSGRADGVVIFLEDTSLIAERVQQTKLAALGRLSASIAHEIRNPLGALSHAGQLLAESGSMGPEDHRLTDIIRVNSLRVSRIVESVLALSKGDKIKPERIDLKSWARDFANEFTRTQELYEGAVALSPHSVDVEVEMDRTHLHQVLWNLCDNAVKYASQAAGAIAVELTVGILDSTGRPYIEVADSGPGIDPSKTEEIFEPFYTAQPGGTGLGLYISRELCERNSASLRYLPRPGGGSLFRIVFSDPERWQWKDDPQ